MMTTRFLPACALLLSLTVSSMDGWGVEGHQLVARLAVASLPADMPAFFRNESERLAFLNPEPDAWRDREEQKLSSALVLGHDGDHIFKFELYSPVTLPPDRYSLIEVLRKEGKEARLVGMLPYRAMELFQRVRVSFRRWRTAPDTKTRQFLEARILDDAGILGHYIADGAMPLHLSVNRNGWELAENPRQYTRDNTLHRRFESDFVRARIHEADVRPLVRSVTVVADGLPYIHAHMRRSFDQVIPLYEMEKLAPFGADDENPEAVKFAATRLADAVSTLRDLWYTAYYTSTSAR